MDMIYLVVQQTMIFAIPLLLVALGGMLSERSGVTNIALEGIMIIGAFCGVLFIQNVNVGNGQLSFVLAMLVAAVAGGLYSILHAYAAIKLKADQTISGTALNMFAPAFCIFMARLLTGSKQLDFTTNFYITKVPLLGDIPVIGPMFFQNTYLSVYIGILIFLLIAFVMKRTRFGMRLMACGENPEAAASVGISVGVMRYAGVCLSGLLGGMGGLIFVVTTATAFNGDVAGYGFLALAVLIFGQWQPVKVLAAAFFFGILKALASSYTIIPFLSGLGLPAEIFKMTPYVITLIVLAFSSKKSAAPKAVGQPFDCRPLIPDLKKMRADRQKEAM